MKPKLTRLLFALFLGMGLTWTLLTTFTVTPTLADHDTDLHQTTSTNINKNPLNTNQPDHSQVINLKWLNGFLRPNQPQPTLSLDEAYQRVLDAGAYEFAAESEQTLIPRPLPNMIGQTDQRVDMHIEGEVTPPDQTILNLSLDGTGLDPTPVAMIQEGTNTYLLREGEKIPVDNPAGLTSPTGDYLSYLAAAENVQPCAAEDAPFAEAVACYTYDMNGQKFAEHVREQMQAQLDSEQGIRPPGVEINMSPSPILRKMTGQGKVWLDSNGLPLRQKVDFHIPEANDYYDSQVRMVIDYHFDEKAIASVLAAQAAEASFLPSPEVVITQVEESLPDMLVLFITLTIALLLVALRRRRWMYGFFAVSISVVILTTPIFQIISYALYSQRIAYAVAPSESIAETFILPDVEEQQGSLSAAKALTTQSLSAAAQAYEPDVYCGLGGNGDRDGDGLADDAEYCLGTNPNLLDSDNDMVPDGDEVFGFEYGKTVTQTWYTNPLNPDSNGDGVNDNDEWAMEDGGLATGWDIDDDGIPNLYDFDDDGDGVADSRDLSPASFTKFVTYTKSITNTTSVTSTTSTTDTFGFNITGSYDGYIYVDMQVQPMNPNHLRYGMTPLDWGYDKEGQIQEHNSKPDEDISLIPMLIVETNLPPTSDLAQEYNVTPFQDTDNDGYSEMLLPLYLTGDGGSVEAFVARMAYGPDTLKTLGPRGVHWRNGRIVWMVRGTFDEENADGTTTQKSMSIHTYVEPAMRLAGWEVTKSGRFRSAIIGTPDMPNDDRALFQLLFGLSGSFLTYQQPDLDEINARFSGANTPAAQKWGITTTVEIDLPPQPYAHYNEGLADVDDRLKSFLSDHYTWDTPNTLLVAGELKSGSSNLNDLGQTEANFSANVNLANITMVTQRSLHLHMFKGWEPVNGGDLPVEVMKRVQPAAKLAIADLKDQYPALTETELVALTQSMYVTWESGRTRTLSVDSITSLPQSTPDQELYEQLYLNPRDRYNDPDNIRTLPGYLVEAGNFAQKGSGLIFTGGSAQTWQYLQSNTREATSMGFTSATPQFFQKANLAMINSLGGATTFGANTDWHPIIQHSKNEFFASDGYSHTKAYIANAVNVTSAIMSITETRLDKIGSTVPKLRAAVKAQFAKKLPMRWKVQNIKHLTKGIRSASKAAKYAKFLSKAGDAMGVAGLVVEIGLYVGIFFANGDFSMQAIAMLIAQIIVAVLMFALSTIPPWIGAVLVAILGIIDLVLMLCEWCQDFLGIDSISSWLTEQIAGYLYKEDPLTEIKDFNFIDRGMTLADESMGYVVGNRLIITDKFEGVIKIAAEDGFDLGAVKDAAIVGGGTGAALKAADEFDLFGRIQGGPSNAENLGDSWICGEFEVSGGVKAVGSTCPDKNADYDLDTIPTNAPKWTYRNPMSTTISFNRAAYNYQIPLGVKVTAQTVWDASIPVPPVFGFSAFLGRIHWTKERKMTLPDDLSDKEKKKWQTKPIYFDILPKTVEEFYNWGKTSTGTILTNHDPDGDGMTTENEINARLGSKAYSVFNQYFNPPFIFYQPNTSTLDRFLAAWDDYELTNYATLSAFCSANPDWSYLCNTNETVFWLDWDSDGDGLSDKFEFDKKGTLGTDSGKYDTDGDGLSDGFEYQMGTRIDKKDSDADGLSDDVEVFHPTVNGTWTGGWDIELPKYGAVGPNGRFTITVRVFSDPLNKDTDGDGLSDFAEKENGTSPTAYNRAPRVALTGKPTAVSPAGISAIYVSTSDRITLTSNLNVYPPYTVSGTMTLDLSGGALSFPTTTKLNGSRSVPNTGVTFTPSWDFSHNVLQPWEYLYATTTSFAPGSLSSSVIATATLSLPFGGEDQVQEATQMIVVDAEKPQFGWVTPTHGEEIGGGVSNYVMGGTSSDLTTWVDHIDLDLPVVGTETITRSGSLSPWAYTWALPGDGIYTLNGRSIDFVDNVSANDSIQVMVDNTAPTTGVNLVDGAVYGPPQDSNVITITLTGTAGENLSGLTRVQISTDGGPWREVWTLETATITNTTFTDHNSLFTNRATYATWDAVWTLPNVATVQGYHSLRVRAFDQAGNWPTYLERNIIIDVMPPTDELINRAYLYEYPHVPANQAHTFNGVANDVGNVPQPSRPTELVGDLDGMDDATIWLGLSNISENDSGVNVAWIGDFNGDRRGDLLVGLPAAADGAGRVAVVYGRSGNWPIPNEQEMLADAHTSFIGTAAAGIGSQAMPAGDVNGDGMADLLIGDPANNRAFLIFGNVDYFSNDLPLDGPHGATWTVLTAPAGEQIGQNLGAAGDVNGDGFADLLIGATGSVDTAYLLLGQPNPWWETTPINTFAAARVDQAGDALLTGVGDLDGDFRDEFAFGESNTLYLFEGKGSYAPQGGTWLNISSSAVDTFNSADVNPQAVALGDVNGDHIDDFIYTNRSSQILVHGDANLHDATWSTQSYSYGTGFLAAPGDVDNDGLNDILIGGGTDAYLILGSDTGSTQSTISGITAAASAPYPAAADLNSDGSSDLLLVPTAAGSQAAAATSSDSMTDLPPTWVPRLPEQTLSTFVGSNNWPPVDYADAYVNADGVCHGLTPCYTTIQTALDAWNDDDLIIVQPGVYGSFFIDGNIHSYNRITIRGTDPDAVFVDANGGSYAARIRNATGVRLENMTLRNAAAGVQLDDAGLNGHNILANRTILDHLLIYDTSAHNVDMSYSSSVSVTHSTLAANSQHIGTFGPADPNITVQWNGMDNSPWPIFDGGGAVAIDDKIYFEMGGGGSGFGRYDAAGDFWMSDPWGPANPYKPNSAIAAGSDKQVYLIGAPTWKAITGGPDWVVDDFATAPNGDVYMTGWFSSPGQDIVKWDGSSWSALVGGTTPLDCKAVAVDQNSGDVYCGGYHTFSKWNGSSWTDLTTDLTYGLAGTVADLAVDSTGKVYIGGDFSIDHANWTKTGGNLAIWDNGSWSPVWDVDGPVNAVAVDPANDNTYAGGAFTTPGDNFVRSFDGGFSWSSEVGVTGGEVKAIDVGPDGTVYVGGEFTGTLKFVGQPDILTPAGIAALNDSTWTAFPEVLPNTVFEYANDLAVTDGGELYAVGAWITPGNADFESFIRWTGTSWEGLNDGFASNSGKVLYAVGDTKYGIFIGGDFNQAGPAGDLISANYLALLQFPHEVYSPTLNSWSSLSGPPMSLQDGAGYVGDNNGNIILLPGGGRSDSFKYNIATDSWTQTGDMPDPVNAGAMTVGENGDIYAVTDGSSSFYKFNSSSWIAIGPQITTATITDGVALTYDSQFNTYYVLPGGNGITMLRYNSSMSSWETLPAGRNTPSGVRPGAALVFVDGVDGNKLYTPQGNYAGDTSASLWMYPIPEPNKVGFEHSVIYAQTASSWLDLGDPLREDFNFRVGDGTLFFGGTGWTPTNSGTLPESSVDPFLDAGRDLYRMGEAGYDIGYHAYTAPVTATTMTGIQAMINSGANRVIVKPGIYEEDVYLVNGVEVIGTNPDWTIIRPLSGSTADALVRAAGATGTSLSRFTLDGQNSGLDGMAVTGNAAYVTLQRALIYDTDTAVSIDGAGSDLEVAHVTAAQNTNGLTATNCASVDVRNSIFAYHTGSGLSHEACAAVKLHTYNLYWANASDFGADADAGAAELFLDPNFVDPMDHDYRTLNFSPIIDAGNPTDPAPPGAGSRADIGYIEQGRVNFYVDDNYCETCINDGLTWHVDAFDNIQDALNAAHNALENLNPSHVDVPQLVVGVAPGTYNAQVMVPSHVLLMGSGAEVTMIDGGGSGTAVTFNSITNAGVRDFTLMNATNAISVSGAANTINIQRNIIRSNTVGVVINGRATANLEYNTIADNTTTGVISDGPGSWAAMMHNIVANHPTGVSAANNGQIFTNYNLFYNTTDFSGASQGDHDLVGQDPLFAGGVTPYRLSETSPALDAASPFATIPNGGGTRADLGYSELLAAPVTLLLGQEDLSTVMGNSGVASVEYGVVQITDTNSLITDTLPGTWSPITLDTPGETISYWTTDYTPIDEGLYRFYSRATDMVGNQEKDEPDWYDGSIVVDSSPPTVAWLTPANGASLEAPLELRAQVSDYAAGAFSVEEKDVYFEIDGQRYPATWAAEPWDESAGGPRVFRTWVTPTVALHSNVVAGAEDKAGNSGTDNSVSFTVTAVSAPDTTPPTVTVTLPVNGSWVTRTVAFSGTVADAGSGIASVEVSVDGGSTWRSAAVTGSSWSLTWEGPENQPLISYPAQVRATDRAGYVTGTAFQFSIDEVAPTGLTPVTFSAPVESHFDVATNLVMTWTAPVDASGIVTTLLTLDQITDTIPTDVVGGNTAVHNLNSNGDWYVHLAAIDATGNATLEHFGPWHVGINEGLGFGASAQSIIIDGYVDIKHDEWRLDSEYLDDDERTIGSEVTFSPGGKQSFLTAWDANNYYMAWRGGWWTLDGELWIYLNSGGGGSSQLITPLASAPAATLPFDANYAINITGPLSGTLYEYSGGWQVSAQSWDFAQGSSGDTEIKLPLFGTSNVETLAFGLGDDRNVWAIFPATNPLNPSPGGSQGQSNIISFAGAAPPPPFAPQGSGGWQPYHWDDITVVSNVADNQPQAVGLEMSLDSAQAPSAMWGPGSTLQYVVQLTNHESTSLTGQQITFTATPSTGLIHDGIAGATCATTNPWSCTIDPLPPGMSVITLTTHLASDLSGMAGITMTAALQESNIPPELTTQRAVTHQTDSTPPEVSVSDAQFVGLGSHTFHGTADDGNGAGVDYVEIRPEGGNWQQVAGTAFWTADLTVSPFLNHGDIWSFEVRAADLHGQVSAAQQFTFTVDLQAPVLSLDTPATLTGSLNEITGSVSDVPTGAEAYTVTVKMDDGPWREAALFAPNEAGDQQYLWTWNMPTEDGVTHTLDVQTVDQVGNMGTINTPQTVWVDNVAPVLTVTNVLTQVAMQHYQPGLALGGPVLSGTVSDGGGLGSVAAWVEKPDGESYQVSANLTGQTWEYTPELEMLGTHRLQIKAFDSLGNVTQTEYFELLVQAAPDSGPNQFMTLEDTSISFAPLLDDLDLDGDNLFLDAIANPAHGSATIIPTTQVVYTPTQDFNGVDVFTYTASDGIFTDTATVTVTVVAVNDPPTLSGSSTINRTMDEDATIAIDFNSSDVDGDNLSWSIVPGSGTAVISSTSGSGNTGAEIAYTPAADFNGSDSFMVRVGDGEYTDQAAVNVTVNPVDDAPRGADDYVVIVPGDAGLPITLDVTANDDEVDGQALVLNAVGVPGLSGAARLSGGQVVYTPTLALGETETFTYTVADGGLTDTAVIHAAMVAGDESGSPGETLVNTNLGDNSSIDLTIDIPGNAAPGDAQMTLVYSETAVTDDAPTGFTVAGLAFTLHAYEDGVFTSPYTLANPMTLTIEYSDADVADIAQGEESLLLYYWSGDEWLSDGITPVQRDTDNNRLVFTINHLTDFALFGGDEYQIYLPITVRP